jgi:alanyl-tRNA synthetase
MNSLEIRQKFFDFFVKRQHEQVASSPLIPAQDPTLLFTNAGMNQFKDCFLGLETRSYKRAVSFQKCIRAGGKHNDLENVGFTKRHLTFFEMMGNFSFGDYFKQDAIQFAWDFLTKELGLSVEKLYASVYYKDEEAYEIWHKQIGLTADHIVKLGEADNFWQMGDTGPCGPCTEIYIDRGIALGCGQQTCAPGCSCDRFLEIWNLVFMQYNRQPDGTDLLLAQKGVDTGMGFERLMVVLQEKDSVYDTDVFMPLIRELEKLSGTSYEKSNPTVRAAFCVLADHVRSASFAIADGCIPSNEGRGYVLRKIIRRAALFSQKLSQKPLLPDLAIALIKQMGSLYPELIEQQKLIITLLSGEVEKFAINLVNGQELLRKYVQESLDGKSLSGEHIFKLYDTFGFPLEITKVIAHESCVTLDLEGFDRCMEQQRLQSGKKMKAAVSLQLPEAIVTHFTGYHEIETQGTIIALIQDNQLVNSVSAGSLCSLITDKSPFYVECGGQVSDKAEYSIDGISVQVKSLKKIGQAIVAEIETPKALAVGETVLQKVDAHFRTNTMKNHTATHLLQAALVSVCGKHIKQAGSLVTADYLRFDFTASEQLTSEQVVRIEQIVNDEIRKNILLTITQTTYKDAMARGVTAFFGDKYNPENVRVVEVPQISAELCGGTHVKATGDIGCFKITELSSLSAGTRRIVAVTGEKAIQLFQETYALIKNIAQEFKVKPEAVFALIKKLKEQQKNAQAEIKECKQALWKMQLPNLIQAVSVAGSVPFLIQQFEKMTVEELKEAVLALAKVKPGFYLFVSRTEEGTRYNLYALLSPEIQATFSIKAIAEILKENTHFQGGIQGNSLQGSCHSFTASVEQALRSYLAAE